MPPPSRPKPFGALILLLAALFLLTLLLVANLILSLPSQAAERFGEPASWLTMQQRYWYSALLLAQEKDLSLPTQTGGAEQEFTVSEGESVASITGRLWEAGLIPSPGAFRTYLLYSGLDTTLKAGKYHFSSGLSPMQIAQAMQSAVSSEVVFTILAGWRAEEIAALYTLAVPRSLAQTLNMRQVHPVPDEAITL